MGGDDKYGTRRNEKADGPATVMAIGKANPQHSVDQSTYPDYYFGITNNQHMIELKNKFKRICERSTIKRRYMHLTEDIHKAPSFDARQDIVAVELPNLAKRAAEMAIHEWGQSKSKITHLVFCTTSTGDMPGADYHLATILGLQSAVNRYMMYQQGCSGGGTVLRLAKDLAENSKGARVLVVCCEILAHSFHGPGEKNSENLVSMALFSDGAAAVIVGADPVIGVEKPLFEVICAAQTIVPGSKEIIQGRLRGDGLTINLKKDVSMFISENIEKCLKETFGRLGVSDWNALFWVVHPGGPAILNKIQDTLNLEPQKLQASRQVLSEYGNMWSASVLFVMDEMRNRSVEQGLRTTGEGMEWGVLFGFGPGLSVETLVLRSVLNRDS